MTPSGALGRRASRACPARNKPPQHGALTTATNSERLDLRPTCPPGRRCPRSSRLTPRSLMSTYLSPRRRARQFAVAAVAALSVVAAIAPAASALSPTPTPSNFGPTPPPTPTPSILPTPTPTPIGATCTPFPGGPTGVTSLAVSEITATTVVLSWTPSHLDTGCPAVPILPAGAYTIKTVDGTVLATAGPHVSNTTL